jgi:protein TonB
LLSDAEVAPEATTNAEAAVPSVAVGAVPWTTNRAPAYPRRALERAWSGTVLLRLSIDASGRVARADVVEGSGHAVLDDAAQATALRWKFDPAQRDGESVESVVLQSVRFTF